MSSHRSSIHNNNHGNARRNEIMKDQYRFQVPVMDTVPYSRFQEYPPLYFYDPSLNTYVKQDRQVIEQPAAPRRLRVFEYEYEVPQPPPARYENYDEQPADEDIDKEAEDFIKLEHRKFVRSKTMPTKE